VAGFENHSGRTYLGNGIRPLGTVLKGNGNNGQDGTEGVRYKNVFGSYSHGPILPKNPDFADVLLTSALDRKYGTAELEPLPDTFEKQAHDAIYSRIMAGTTSAD
jgi:CobQ-like glutamine amidotransferase family enzyme